MLQKGMVYAHSIHTACGLHAFMEVCWRKRAITDAVFDQVAQSCAHAQHMAHKERDPMVSQPIQGCTRGAS